MGCSRFGDDGDDATLRELGAKIGEADLKHKGKTLYSLLELSSATVIARAAVETKDPSDLPDGNAWILEDIDERDEKNVPRLRLSAGPLRCRISKDAPAEQSNTRKDDTLIPLLDQMGYRATGNQPDIVITFSRKGPDGREKSIFVLADAKRNAGGSGKEYLSSSIDAAIVYAVSYGHRMGLRFHPGGAARIDGDVLPAVTLFCRQGVKKIAGVGPGEQDIIARLRNDDAALPAIMAFDFDHFGFRSDRSGWRSPILSAWFGRLARQASKALQRVGS